MANWNKETQTLEDIQNVEVFNADGAEHLIEQDCTLHLAGDSEETFYDLNVSKHGDYTLQGLLEALYGAGRRNVRITVEVLPSTPTDEQRIAEAYAEAERRLREAPLRVSAPLTRFGGTMR